MVVFFQFLNGLMRKSDLCYTRDIMSNKVKVSVLVPIYNVEEFLPGCLDSLVGQTLKEIEIICINDGSKDHSLEIIKEYAKKDSRIKIIDKKNSGYGDSMNQGLKEATGEYVGIVESDDFIDLDAFKKLYRIAKEKNVEVVKGNFYYYYGDRNEDDGKSNLFPPSELGRVIDPRSEHGIFYQAPCIWAAIYKNEFLKKNEIGFLPTPGAAYQDAGFNFKVWAMARRVYFIRRAFLHYRQDNANSSVKDSGKVYCVKDEYDEVERYLREKDLINELGSVAFTCRFGGYVWNLERLRLGAAMKFAKVVKDDYRRAKSEGYLDDERIDGVGRYNAELMEIKHPRLYLLFRPINDVRDMFGNAVKRIIKAISPRYRQRLKTIHYIEKLNDVQGDIAEMIAEVEQLKMRSGDEKKNR